MRFDVSTNNEAASDGEFHQILISDAIPSDIVSQVLNLSSANVGAAMSTEGIDVAYGVLRVVQLFRRFTDSGIVFKDSTEVSKEASMKATRRLHSGLIRKKLVLILAPWLRHQCWPQFRASLETDIYISSMACWTYTLMYSYFSVLLPGRTRDTTRTLWSGRHPIIDHALTPDIIVPTAIAKAVALWLMHAAAVSATCAHVGLVDVTWLDILAHSGNVYVHGCIMCVLRNVNNALYIAYAFYSSFCMGIIWVGFLREHIPEEQKKQDNKQRRSISYAIVTVAIMQVPVFAILSFWLM